MTSPACFDALRDVGRAAVVAPHEPAGLREPHVGPGQCLQQQAQAGHLEAVGLHVVVHAPALGGVPELLAKRLDVGHRVGQVKDLGGQDRARRALAAQRPVVGRHELRPMADRLAAVVGLVPRRVGLDPGKALAHGPELELQALGGRQRAALGARVADRDERLHVEHARLLQPVVERLELPGGRHDVPADRDARVAHAERDEARVAEHVGLLVADADPHAAGQQRRGRGRDERRERGRRRGSAGGAGGASALAPAGLVSMASAASSAPTDRAPGPISRR